MLLESRAAIREATESLSPPKFSKTYLVVSSSGASGRGGIFAKSPRCETSRQSAQLWNSQALTVKPLLRIERSQLPWFVHVSRMPHERLVRQLLLAKPTGKPPKGRPTIDVGAGNFWGGEGLFLNFPKLAQKGLSTNMIPKKNKTRMHFQFGALFVKSKHIQQFSQSFHTFCPNVTDFARIWKDFAQIFTKSKVWRCDCTPFTPASHTSSSTDQVEWLHLRPCLVSSWCGASRIIWNCCQPWGISSPPRAAAPTTFHRGKAGLKMKI